MTPNACLFCPDILSLSLQICFRGPIFLKMTRSRKRKEFGPRNDKKLHLAYDTISANGGLIF